MKFEILGPCPKCGDHRKPCRCSILAELDRLKGLLKYIREKMCEISLHGHHNKYDWNADPKSLTLIEGNMFTAINEALGEPEKEGKEEL
jgi:hypothetical protein